MAYDVPVAPGESGVVAEGAELEAASWPMWEVFVRARRGISHVHIGSLHAADADTALQSARDVYTRRGEGASLWVVRSSEIHAFEPEEIFDFVDANEKPYRLATTYDIPDEVGHM